MRPCPQLANTHTEIAKCFAVMQELRPHLQEHTFVETVCELQKGGYKLAFVEEESRVVALAGYRIAHNLFMGKHLYVDDLVTSASQRSKGYGELLIQWLREQALSSQCQYFHLDSGTHRHDAHRFYFRQGLSIASYHFSETL